MGDDEQDAERWLPPSGNDPSGSVPPPGGPQQGEAKWGAPAPPPAPGPAPGQPSVDPGQSVGAESYGSATTALVCGILGVILCPLILSIIAIVKGNNARKVIDRSGGRYNNRGSATAGIVLGWVGIAIFAIGVIYGISQAGTPDDNGNGVPDGLDNKVIVPLLGVARVAAVGLSALS
jgi:hypothetical protein